MNNSATPNFFQVMLSVFAAMFGVQNMKTQKRDFRHGKASAFIAGGLLFTTTFVVSLVAIVLVVIN